MHDQPPVASGGDQLSQAEIDALEYVVVEGRIASVQDHDILRALLTRVQPQYDNR